MVITNISPSMVGITAMVAVDAMAVQGGPVVEGTVLPADVTAADAKVVIVEGKVVRVVVKAAVVKDVMAVAPDVKAVAAIPGNPRLVVLPHPHSAAAAEGGDRLC